MIKKLILRTAEKCKPLLMKVFPKKLLRAIKQRTLAGMIKEIENFQGEPYEKGTFPYGINLIGNIKAETGLGQSCRLLANLFEKADIPFSVYYYDSLAGTKDSDTTWNHKLSQELPYSINLFHINPSELGMAYVRLESGIWKGHYNIGFWLWELEEFPEEWIPCFNLFHEIWTPSEFISNALRQKTDKPVRTMPYHVTAELEETCGRAFFGLPEDKFLFLMMYDSASVMERKNPMGVIRAFKEAFSKEDTSVGLVIKMKGHSPEEEKMLRAEMEGYQNLYFVTEVLTKAQVGSLLSCVDVFVSLHRAEGFGLVMAEAMLLGTPVIATNWSANTEFMNSTVACMVDYELVPLEQDYGPFKKGQRWAAPDEKQAAGYMRRLYEDAGLRRELSKKGKEALEKQLGAEGAAMPVKERIGEVA